MTNTSARVPADFKPEIQALRALAVILVVLYHLSFAGLSGGYVGVDIFFVVSGYLITAHLLREAQRSGTISLPRFWARRIRRLLPASLTVLAASAIAAMVWVPKAQWQQTAQEIGASALYVQNWLLASNSTDYLAADNSASLVQHFWSLSVEEQFYFIWPIVLIAALFAMRALSRGISARTTFALALGLITVASFLYAIIVTANEPSVAYFSTPARAWEFSAGGMIAVLALDERVSRLSAPVRAAIAWVGLALMITSAVWFTAATPFPGVAALIPVVGALLFISAGNVEAVWSPGHLNHFRPVQLLGDLSYGIYLWHWPLIVLYPHIFGTELTLIAGVFIVAVTVLLAYLTKRFIEDPVRLGRLWNHRTAHSFVMGAAGMLVVVALASTQWVIVERGNDAQAARAGEQLASGDDCFGAAAMVSANNCASPFAVTEATDPTFAQSDLYENAIDGRECHINESNMNSELIDCVLGSSEDPETTIALVGDSHAGQIRNALAKYAEENNIRLVVHARSGCAGFESVEALNGSKKGKPEFACAEWAEKVRTAVLDDDSIDVVLFANRTEFVASNGSISAFWKDLIAADKEVIALRDFPGMPNGELGPECLAAADSTDDPCAADRDEVLPSQDSMLKAADSLKGDVTVVDLSGYFCDEDTCHAVIGGVPVYADDDHITLTYAETLMPYLGAELEDVITG